MGGALDDDFYGKPVQVVRFEKESWSENVELFFREEFRGEFGGEESAYLKKSALKALRGAKPGDIVEIDQDYNDFRAPIVNARRVTGTPEDGIRRLTERVEALEGILKDLPTLIRAAADEVRGERYEDTKRIHHAVAMKVESRLKKVFGE